MGWRYIQGPEGRHVCIIKPERIQCVPTASLKDKSLRSPPAPEGEGPRAYFEHDGQDYYDESVG